MGRLRRGQYQILQYVFHTIIIIIIHCDNITLIRRCRRNSIIRKSVNMLLCALRIIAASVGIRSLITNGMALQYG